MRCYHIQLHTLRSLLEEAVITHKRIRGAALNIPLRGQRLIRSRC